MELAVHLRDLSEVGNRGKGARRKLTELVWAGIRHFIPSVVLEQLPDHETGLDRLYVGDEFCPHRLPGREELLALCRWAQHYHLAVTLLTPFMTDGELQRCLPLVELINHEHPECDVVVNDWGGLRAFRDQFPDVRLSAGRVFNKAFKDPRGMRPMERSASSVGMDEVWRYSAFGQPEFRRLARDFGVTRLERDLLPYETNVESDSPGFATSIYFPWGYVTTGRVCWISSFGGKARDRYVPLRTCSKPCQDFSLSLTHESCDLELVQCGNTVYYLYSHAMLQGLMVAAASSSVRLVYQGVLL
jgi:hypothetical protein